MQDDPHKSQPPASDPPLTHPAAAGEVPPPANPAWAKDLRELYNSVVEEPLPANIMALLSKLDTDD